MQLSILSVISVVFTHARLSSASFLATGPPAAPVMKNLGRSRNFYEAAPELVSWHNRTRITAAFNSTDLDLSESAPGGSTWLTDSTFAHKMPYASAGYKVFRNVRDYGAKGNGIADDWAAIQRAISAGNRCGKDCSATSTTGAIIYFPPGKYAISKPIVQLYYTSFIGDLNNRPQIKPLPNFQGIALIDTDVYEAGGKNWWSNQNNFYRQIRNLIIDMRQMRNTIEGGVELGNERKLPVGIHWQVAQACTLQNIDFYMPQTADTRHIGLYQENGSGGFVSDLTFIGGKNCWAAGSQQYSARHVKFRGCKTAIHMIWAWHFNFHDIDVDGSEVAIDATQVSQEPDRDTERYQGTASLNVIDSSFTNVKEVIRINKAPNFRPSLLIENIAASGTSAIVQEYGGKTLLASPISGPWTAGPRVADDVPNGLSGAGAVKPSPRRPESLLSNGKFFGRSKPSYAGEAVLDVLAFGAKNDGDLSFAAVNRKAIQEALHSASRQKRVLVFPAGIYAVDNTLEIPVGSRITGALWSQIMAVGPVFGDASKPAVLARAGNTADKGVLEISDMMFTTNGNTAGAILIEWNVHEDQQGSAAMWDVIVRVGGAKGTDLTVEKCLWTRKFQTQDHCMASSLMLRATSKSSIYMENMWLWVADHDIDDATQTRVNVYGGRGVLIESKGPSWIRSVSNEHSTLYNWQLSGAENIFLSQIQSETPYFQAGQLEANQPYLPGQAGFTDDPRFDHCTSHSGTLSRGSPQSKAGDKLQPPKGSVDTCREAWALRILNSTHVYLYGGGFYSFFQDYKDTCSKDKSKRFICQDRIIDTAYSEEIWMYNLHTIGAMEVVSPQGKGLQTIDYKNLLNGYTTSLAAWLMLAGPGKKSIGGTRKSLGGLP